MHTDQRVLSARTLQYGRHLRQLSSMPCQSLSQPNPTIKSRLGLRSGLAYRRHNISSNPDQASIQSQLTMVKPPHSKTGLGKKDNIISYIEDNVYTYLTWPLLGLLPLQSDSLIVDEYALALIWFRPPPSPDLRREKGYPCFIAPFQEDLCRLRD